MAITGIIKEIRKTSSTNRIKLKVEEGLNTWWVEVRGKKIIKSNLLKEGDKVFLGVYSNARETLNNTFNNIIVKEIKIL